MSLENFFINYSYLPRDNEFTGEIGKDISKMNFSNFKREELQDYFYDIFSDVMKEMFESIPKHKKIVIPLSGGLDSRSILAFALLFIEKSRIVTYTFGVPGAYDYEIGGEIAKLAGTKHFQIDLNRHQYSEHELDLVCKYSGHSTFLFHHPPIHEINQIISDGIVISGYLGDLVFGSYSNFSQINSNDAYSWYLNKNRVNGLDSSLNISSHKNSYLKLIQKQLYLLLSS